MTARIHLKKPIYLTNVDDHADVYFGSRKPDLVYGFRGDDTLFGLAGDDLIKGGMGRDLIDGGRGNDRLLGEWGDDFLFGGCGNDVMTGGSGSDQFGFGRRAGIDKISDFETGFDVVSFLAERVIDMGSAVIDRIRLSTNQLHAVIEWSWQDQHNRIILTDVTVAFVPDDFANFAFSDAALAWFG